MRFTMSSVLTMVLYFVGVQGMVIEFYDFGTISSTIKTTPVLVEPVEDCLWETKADKSQVMKLVAGNWNIKLTPLIKRWMLCFLMKNGIMTEAGILYQDVVLRRIVQNDRKHVIKIIDKCLYKKHHLPQETAWNYMECFHNTNAKLSEQIHGL